MSLTQQLNDLLYKAFTVDGNGNIALRMTLQTGTVQSWKDPVASLANLPPSGNTSGDVRMTMDTGLLYRWNGTAWVQANAYSSGQGISISGQTVAIDLDANSGLQFISGKLALKADGTTTEISSGSLRVKPGVFASLVHTHISSDITDWTTALNTWLATKTTANLTENTNLYFTQARVLATPLTGLSLATGTAIVATDTELVAFGKLQKQISDEVTARSNADATKEGTITAGTTAQYWRGDKSWQTLNTTAVAEGTNLYYTNSRGIGSVLTGLSLATSTDIVATDSILTAMGKLQAQNTAQGTAIGLRALDSGVVHLAGTETITGLKTIQATSTDWSSGIQIQGGTAGQGFNPILIRNDIGQGWNIGLTGSTNSSAQGNNSVTFYNNTTGFTSFFLKNDGNVGFNGNVGIGTATPTEKLEVLGNISLSGDYASMFFKKSSLNKFVTYQFGDGGSYRIGRYDNLGNFIDDVLIIDRASGDLYWKTQNWTSAWTNYTPSILGGTGGSGTASISVAKYKLIGKTCFVNVRIQVTNKNTLSGNVIVTLPFPCIGDVYTPLNGFCVANGGNPDTQSKGNAEADTGSNVKFKKGFNTAWLGWSDIVDSDWLVFNGQYEIA